MTNANDYGIVVGIDVYPGYRSLKGAVKDAQDFATWLCDDTNGGGVPTDNCKTVYSVSTPLSPLQQQVDEAFDAVLSSIPKGKLAHRLYVYFSGHGMAESNLISDLCLANWAQKFPNRALDAQQYLDTVMKLGKFEEIVMLLDCCRVRLVSARGHIPDFLAPSPGPQASKARYFLANATEFLNSSFEAATSTSSDSENPLVRGYFTRVLMSALRGAAAVKTGGVPASKLKNYLEENVSALAKTDGYVQEPEVVNGLRGDPLFGSAPPPPPELAAAPGTPGPGAPPTVEERGVGKTRSRVPLTLDDSLGVRLLTVMDKKEKTVFRGSIGGTKELKLPSGSYKVRTEFDHVTIETLLDLDEPTRLSTREQLPSAHELYTATPLAQSPTSHEYYTGPSQQWSQQPTRPPVAGVASSSLFIFIRAIDRESYDSNTNLSQDLLLLDRMGNEVSDFSPSSTQRNGQVGWLAFHVAAPHGTLFLRFTGKPDRETSLQLYPGWQTQLFLMNRGKPLLETMKIFLAPLGAGFRPKDRESGAADMALNGLQSNQDLLTDSALDLLLSGKFENPMLGLVAAHVLLQRQRAFQTRLSLENRRPRTEEQKQQNQRQRTIRVVLQNLSRLVPGSPDVAALHLLAGSITPSSPHKFTFGTPPMLRPGLMAVISEAIRRPAILAQDSLIPQIAPFLYVDTPWSTWQPIAPDKTAINWVHLAIVDSVRKAIEPGDEKQKMSPLGVPQLAESLRLPQQTISQAAMDLETSPARVREVLRDQGDEFKDVIGLSGAQLDKRTRGEYQVLFSVLGTLAGNAAEAQKRPEKKKRKKRERVESRFRQNKTKKQKGRVVSRFLQRKAKKSKRQAVARKARNVRRPGSA
jgi:Caspase domain